MGPCSQDRGGRVCWRISGRTGDNRGGCKALDIIRDSRIIQHVRTVIETPEFKKQAAALWTEDERMEFVCWIAEHPLAGDVIPGAKGARKVRWAVAGRGKRGGVRVVYWNLSSRGEVVLVMIYAKNDRGNVAPNEIGEI